MKTELMKFVLCRAYQSDIARQRAIKMIQKEHGYNVFHCAEGKWQNPKGPYKQYFLAFAYDAEAPNNVVVVCHPEFTWNPTNENGAMKVIFLKPEQILNLDEEEDE